MHVHTTRYLALLFLLIIVLLRAAPALAVLDTGPNYEVKGNIVVIARCGALDRPEATTKARDFCKSDKPHSKLSERGIQTRVVRYLKRHIAPEVTSAFALFVPDNPNNWQVSTTNTLIQIDYMPRVLKTDSGEQPVVAFTVKRLRPQFSKQETLEVGSPYITDSNWKPVVSIPISTDPDRLEKDLEEAMDALLGGIAQSMFVSSPQFRKE